MGEDGGIDVGRYRDCILSIRTGFPLPSRRAKEEVEER